MVASARLQGEDCMIGWIALGVIVLVLLYLIAIYNRLVRLRAQGRSVCRRAGRRGG